MHHVCSGETERTPTALSIIAVSVPDRSPTAGDKRVICIEWVPRPLYTDANRMSSVFASYYRPVLINLDFVRSPRPSRVSSTFHFPQLKIFKALNHTSHNRRRGKIAFQTNGIQVAIFVCDELKPV
ncbi:hypothetical protein J6590_072211 [Homalodisca vitripennis]|nr:hypothetical protein J6590_072211 [Homalodisca vitripennis]